MIRALAVLLLLASCGTCEGTGPCPSECDPDSAELAALTWHEVQALAEYEGECLLVCVGPYRRMICPTDGECVAMRE